MPYIITGTATFSSQANRDAARTRLDAAIATYNLINVTTVFNPGITHPTTTTMTISVDVDGHDPGAVHKSIYDAWVASNRPVTCYLSVNKV